MLLDFGDLVESLDGRYVTAEDVGTGAADMAVIAERTAHVVGLPAERGGSGDPEPGHRARRRGRDPRVRRAPVRRRRDSPACAVCVVGLGHVGGRLADAARGRRRELTVATSTPPGARSPTALGARWIDARRRDHRRLRRARAVRAGRRRSTRRRSTRCAAGSSAARPTTSSPTTRSPSAWPQPRDHLRARLHRQRRRPDQRLRRAPPPRPRRGHRPGRQHRPDGPPHPRRGRPPRHDSPGRGPDPCPAPPPKRHRHRLIREDRRPKQPFLARGLSQGKRLNLC